MSAAAAESTAAGRPWSLAVRLGWRLAAVMLSAMLLAAAGIAWRAIATVHELDDGALQTQVGLIVAALPAAAHAGLSSGGLLLPAALTARFRASDGDNVFLVFAGTRLVAESDPGAVAALGRLLERPPPGGFFRLPPLPGHPHGMIGLSTATGPFQVMVLQGREQTQVLLDSLAGHFLAGAVWLLLPLGAATVLVGVTTLERGLRPVRRVSAAASLVGPGRPGARLPTAALPSEIAPLVQAANAALARMEQALLVQRRFVAEAAHGLRTPLAVLTARLDLLDDHPELDGLRHDAERMARLVGQLLRMARLEAVPLPMHGLVGLHAVAVEAVSTLVPLALRHAVELALHEPAAAAQVRGNGAALVVALSNLIENAIFHAPSGSAVEIRIEAPATLCVLDRGPGVSPEHRARIFDRFERGVGAGEGGAGLGLAIVAEIAAAHRGDAAMRPRPGGGAMFVLRLPEAHGQEMGTARAREAAGYPL